MFTALAIFELVQNELWNTMYIRYGRQGGLMVSALDSGASGALAGYIMLCSWARHFTLTVSLSTQVYKWVPVNCLGNLTNCGGVTYDGLASHPGEVEILPAASCYRNWDKLWQLWALSYIGYVWPQRVMVFQPFWSWIWMVFALI